jgi:hypothetical protein
VLACVKPSLRTGVTASRTGKCTANIFATPIISPTNGVRCMKLKRSKVKRAKFKNCEAIVFDPSWWEKKYAGHPLSPGEVVYFLGEIPNVPGHCVVAKHSGEVVSMVHPEDFRKAKDEEL